MMTSWQLAKGLLLKDLLDIAIAIGGIVVVFIAMSALEKITGRKIKRTP